MRHLASTLRYLPVAEPESHGCLVRNQGEQFYCGLQSVACGFPVFVMVETEQKGVSRLWSLTLSEIFLHGLARLSPLLSCHLIFSVHQKCQAHAEIILTPLLDQAMQSAAGWR